jgi:hypothetical protein
MINKNELSFMPRSDEFRQQQCEAEDSQQVSEIVHRSYFLGAR